MKNGIIKGVLLAAILSGAVAADGRPVARVVDCAGVEVRSGLKSVAPLTAGVKLEEGTSLNLPPTGRAQLLFYGDGHREELLGPCLVRVGPAGCLVVRGGSACLTRIVAQHRKLVLPQGSNLQAVGGSVAGVSDSSMLKGDRLPRPASGDVNKERNFRASVVPGPINVHIESHQGALILTLDRNPARDVEFYVRGSKLDKNVDYTDGKLSLPKLPRDGGPYRVLVYRDSTLEQRVPIRLLNSQEEQQLADLQKKQPNDEEELLAIEGLERLGFPSLAAQKAEALLAKLDYNDPGLANYLYGLYTGTLCDSERAKALQGHFEKRGQAKP